MLRPSDLQICALSAPCALRYLHHEIFRPTTSTLGAPHENASNGRSSDLQIFSSTTSSIPDWCSILSFPASSASLSSDLALRSSDLHTYIPSAFFVSLQPPGSICSACLANLAARLPHSFLVILIPVSTNRIVPDVYMGWTAQHTPVL